MAKKKNIQKVAEGLNAEYEFMSDGSGSFISIENKTHSLCISFDGKGEVFTDISIAKKIYEVVDEKIIAEFSLVEKEVKTKPFVQSFNNNQYC